MITTRSRTLAAVIAGVLFICGSLQAQNALLTSRPSVQASDAPAAAAAPNGPTSAPTAPFQRMPRTVAPRIRQQGKTMSIDELLSGITLADDQKPKIEQVRKDMRGRMDTVIHDKNENQDQKQAMLQGLQHMELRQVYQLLTPEQQSEVRKKVAAQQTDQQQRQKVQQPPQAK